ncbi:MAG: MerR family transcriptional regulator [Clostridia bacterium]|nr:MerR family transcriptional regulator [Clostridia bacterium]
MITVHEVSALSGVTIRTLRYYDRIGLLKPAARTEAGYRLYDDADLMRLQRILLLRELEIPLRDVSRLLKLSETGQREAIGRQITLLELKKERTEKLIALARRLSKGEETMDFSAFDRSKEEAYAAEARARWGETEEYHAYEKKATSRTEAEGSLLLGRMMGIFADFGALRDGDPASDAAQAKVRELQDFISTHYYPCTDEILRGLAQMYVADERFRANIDAAGGEGTAAFVQQTIAAHCKKG